MSGNKKYLSVINDGTQDLYLRNDKQEVEASTDKAYITGVAPVVSGNTETVPEEPVQGKVDTRIYTEDGNLNSRNVLLSNYKKEEIFLERPTGKSHNEVATGLASVQAVGGNGCAWNVQFNEDDFVDMGLPSGTLWAKCNIDITQPRKLAASPFQYDCSFFSWGNIDGHNPTSVISFSPWNWGRVNAQEPWYEGQPYGNTKGNTLTGNIPVGEEFDAARANLGAPWRMPTNTEYGELFANIRYINADGSEIPSSQTDKRVTVNGVVGLYLESTINGARLFFSASGYGAGASRFDRGSSGFYWSATWGSARYARYIDFSSGGVNPQRNYNRYYGFAVRAVSNKGIVNGTNNRKYFASDKIISDLTLLGIDGNDYDTPEKVEDWLATHIGTKPYYPYNAGTLLPAKLQAYKTTGRSANLLNPTTRTARLFAYTWPDHNNMFTIKELPSDLTLTFTPDATGVAETIAPDSNGHFSVSGSGNLVVSGSADLSATWLIATWDESMDSYDNFEAWDGKEYAFDTSKIYGKLNREDDYVQVFPNGMRGAGSARDMIDLAKAEVRKHVADVDLGDLSWGSSDNYFRASLEYYGAMPNLYNKVCDKYACLASTRSKSIDKNLAVWNTTGYNKMLTVYNTAFASYSSAQVKTAMAGVKLWYELATPLHYTDCVYRDNGVDTPLSELNILVNNWAYEQAVVGASAFDTTKAYAKGDYVTYEGTQYRFTSAHAAGAWNSNDVVADNAIISCAAQSLIDYTADVKEQLGTLIAEKADRSELAKKADKCVPANVGNIAALDSTGNLADSTIKSANVAQKAEGITPTSGNFAAWDNDGHLVDSTKKASDFANASHTHSQYLTSSDITGKANKSEMSVSTNSDTTTITLKSGTSATVINQHQDITGKADKADLNAYMENADLYIKTDAYPATLYLTYYKDPGVQYGDLYTYCYNDALSLLKAYERYMRKDYRDNVKHLTMPEDKEGSHNQNKIPDDCWGMPIKVRMCNDVPYKKFKDHEDYPTHSTTYDSEEPPILISETVGFMYVWRGDLTTVTYISIVIGGGRHLQTAIVCDYNEEMKITEQETYIDDALITVQNSLPPSDNIGFHWQTQDKFSQMSLNWT